MHKALTDLPVLDRESFLKQIADWKSVTGHTKPGGDRIVVEWGVAKGPWCFVYPVAKRKAGINLTAGTPHTTSDERWADFLEFQFIPPVVQALKDGGFKSTVICVDLRPIQIMRERLRALQSVAEAKTGVAPHH